MFYRLFFFIPSLFFFSCASVSPPIPTSAIQTNQQKPSTYWQQHVSYTMDIDMNINNYQYTGKQTLIYTNNSPDVLHKVFYHLYFNAFQPDSEMDARLQTVKDPDRRMVTNVGTKEKPIYESRISKLKPDEIGFIKVNGLQQNGQAIAYKTEGTILEVTLNKPILSGETVVFKIDFTAQVPVQIRRSGRNNKGGVALSMTQWYPKMAEYDFEGWHADPYIAREFYGVWGDFDVTIHIDKDYMLGGTGYLQNPQEIGYGYENPKLEVNRPKTNKLAWHFKATKVHDFTWVADKDFVHDIQKTNDGTTLHFIYKNNPNIQENWKKMQPIAVKTMDFYNKLVGRYAYNQYTIIQGGDGGMEYAMCTLITAHRSFKGLVGTMMHEMGHAWFQFALATNESQHEWMDEGFTTYIEAIASDEIMHNKGSFIFENSYNYYYFMVKTGLEEPLTTHADRYNTNMSYGINAYDKGLVFIAQLAYIIGQESLDKTIKQYYKDWSGKHPSPTDFIRVAERVSGLELSWYLNEFTQTIHTIDYGIKKVDNKTITLVRLGQIPMPIDIEVTYTDGSKESYYIPLNLMRGEKQTNATLLPDWDWGHQTYSFQAKKKLKEVQIDTSLLMADVNRANNQFKQ